MTVVSGSCKFVCKKIRKVKWCPRSDSTLLNTGVFAAGSWDEESNEVSVWQAAVDESSETCDPVKLASFQKIGDITGINWISRDLLAVATSEGELSLLKLEQNRSMTESENWKGLHQGGATCLAYNGELLATAGEDGKVNIINAKQRSVHKVYEKADSCSITDLTFPQSSEIVTSNLRGQLKLFDLKSNSTSAVSTYMLSSDQTAVTVLTRHPTQGHILLTGSEDGCMAVWDMRQGRFPVTLLAAHQAPISDVQFHPDMPDHIFTASQGGELWHWNGSSIKSGLAGVNGGILDSLNSLSPWLSSDAVKHKVETNSLVSRQPLPINTLDVMGHTVLFGGDNEALYLLNNVVF